MTPDTNVGQTKHVAMNVEQLEQVLNLARRSHYGTAAVAPVTRDGLDYLAVDVVLTDMGDRGPLHTFYLSPRGVLSS